MPTPDELYDVLFPGGRGDADPVTWAGRLTAAHDAVRGLQLRLTRERNATIREAYAEEGMSRQLLGDATGMSKGRVNQILRKPA